MIMCFGALWRMENGRMVEEEEGVVMMLTTMMDLPHFFGSNDVTRIIFVEYDNGQTFSDLKTN
jgi:hypothetical protein